MIVWNVMHKAMGTDDLVWNHTLIRARSKQEAASKYEKIAKTKKAYPHCWAKCVSDVEAHIWEYQEPEIYD